MKNILLILLFVLPSTAILANDEEEIKAVINKMFEGMAKGDSAMVRSVFYRDASLTTIVNKKGKIELVREDLSNFFSMIGTPHKDVWNEKIKSFEINNDVYMASAWTPYNFYINATFSHCGVNNFILIRTEQGWKITAITDTRYKQGCEE